MPQDKVYLDEQGNPIKTYLDENGEPIKANAPSPTPNTSQEPSLFQQMNTPVQSQGSNAIAQNASRLQQMRYNSPNQSLLSASVMGFAEGAMEGARSLMTPLNLAFGLTGAGEMAGSPGIARIAGMASKPLSGMVAAEGGYHISQGKPYQGIAELAGGLAGLKAKLPQVANEKLPIIETPPVRTGPLALPPGQIELGPPSGIKTTFNTKGRPVVRGADNKFRGPASAEIPYAGSPGAVEQPSAFRAQVDLPIVEGKVVASEPAPAKGTVRLYRGEGPDQTAGGRWFTPDKDTAQFYIDFGGGKGKLHYVDIPESHYRDIVEEARLAGEYGGENHLYIGEKYTKQAKPLGGGTPIIPPNKPPVTSAFGEPVDFQSQAHLGNVTDIKQPSAFQEAINLPRALKSSLDLSAPLRQGFGLIGRKEWWNNLGTQFKALRSEENFKAIQQSIAEKPLFKPRMGLNGKTLPSYAEEAGLKLTDLTNLSSREEALMSTWAEKVPGVRASNRAYTAFLNKLRADTFESLVKDLDLSKDLTRAGEIAEFINDATGRGSLKAGPINLEKHAQLLNSTFFSPRLIASRVRMYNRMLNPVSYMQASPVVRKEALRSLLSMTAAGSTVLGLASMAGAEVSSDPNSADFGKAKIGNTRLDPWAGFQQYAVAASRLLQGKYTSSTSSKEHKLGSGYGEMTRKDVAENFAANKLHPTWKFAYDLLNSSDYRQFNIPEETVRLFVPMVAEDLYDLWKEDPSLIPVLGPLSASGMGVQTYSQTAK